MSQSPGAPAPTSPIEACRTVFGQHPEDVIVPIKLGSDAFDWLSALFKAIELFLDHRPTEVEHLVALGRYIATDMSDYLDCAREQMTDSIKAAEAREGGAI
jgi:hypothetical protein